MSPADDGYFYIKPDDVSTVKDGGLTFEFKIVAWADGYSHAAKDSGGTAYYISELLHLYVVCGPNSATVSPPASFTADSLLPNTYLTQTQTLDVSSTDSFVFLAFTSSNPNCGVTSHTVVTSTTDLTFPSDIAAGDPTYSGGFFRISPADPTQRGSLGPYYI